uniref:Uncharacterized protein n=1 Tax=Ciona intestinalis TaxID=7719 RepID=H2XWE3_CIOIN
MVFIIIFYSFVWVLHVFLLQLSDLYVVVPLLQSVVSYYIQCQYSRSFDFYTCGHSEAFDQFNCSITSNSCIILRIHLYLKKNKTVMSSV